MADGVVMHGPVFSGRAEAEVQTFQSRLEYELAAEAAARIRDFLPSQYKYLGHSGGTQESNPVPQNAGYYASQVNAEAGAEGARVTDSGVVYGSWLEGTSERNAASRFPGYGAFRKVHQQMEAEAGKKADAEIRPVVAALNE